MSRPPGLLDRALALWAQGLTARAIGAEVGRCTGTVEHWICFAREEGDPRAKLRRHRWAKRRAEWPRLVPRAIRHPEGPHAPADLTKAILYEVAVAHGVSVAGIRSASTRPFLVAARREAAARLSAERKLSTTQIGRILGNRHHTTILNLLGRTRAAAKRAAAATKCRP